MLFRDGFRSLSTLQLIEPKVQEACRIENKSTVDGVCLLIGVHPHSSVVENLRLPKKRLSQKSSAVTLAMTPFAVDKGWPRVQLLSLP
jgi:hypothetical protein